MDEAAFRPGDLVGPYQVLALLARGGLSSLYLALDSREGSMAALKTLRSQPGPAGEAAFARFRREVEILARIDDPHVVRVRGEVEPCRAGFYVPLEFVRGQNLEVHLGRSGPLTLPQAAVAVRQIATGLAAVHRAGAVHRDLKPANVMIEDPGRRLRIVDFGLAIAEDLARVTRTGHFLGTPRYVAPEQHLGRTDVDARADLYALGAIAYEMIAGGPPFGQDDLAELVRAKDEGRWTRLSSIRTGIDPSWDAWLARMLARRREDRFDSVERAMAEMPGS